MIRLHLPDDLAAELGLAQHSERPLAPCVGDLLAALEAERPGLARRVLQADGALRPHLRLFLGERALRGPLALATPLADGDDVWLLRAVSGG